VSYLNAKPLIDGLDEGDAGRGLSVKLDVPARLLDDLIRSDVDLALCPIIDYFRSAAPLVIVPVGAIGCHGPTLTVRLFSRVPWEQVDALHADLDSHTSVNLALVVLWRMFGRRPRVAGFDAYAKHDEALPATLLLIGDKVVTSAPAATEYPHQLDLGQAWKTLTGMPFVFATWLARADADLGDAPARLEALRRGNATRIDAIVDRHAQAHGWPADLARDYLGHLLRYEMGEPQFAAVRRFADEAAALGLIPAGRPLRFLPSPAGSGGATGANPEHGDVQPSRVTP
jgi:chorismate dehydratase